MKSKQSATALGWVGSMHGELYVDCGIGAQSASGVVRCGNHVSTRRACNHACKRSKRAFHDVALRDRVPPKSRWRCLGECV